MSDLGEPLARDWWMDVIYRRFISFVLLTANFWLVSMPATLAQVHHPGPTVIAKDDLPEPQFLAPSVEPVDGQPVPGQSRNNAGVKEGQSDNVRQPLSALDPLRANISGTVTHVNGDVVPGASIVLEGADTSDRQTVVAGDSGAFQFGGLKPGIPYHITIEAKGFEPWKVSVRPRHPVASRHLVMHLRYERSGSGAQAAWPG